MRVSPQKGRKTNRKERRVNSEHDRERESKKKTFGTTSQIVQNCCLIFKNIMCLCFSFCLPILIFKLYSDQFQNSVPTPDTHPKCIIPCITAVMPCPVASPQHLLVVMVTRRGNRWLSGQLIILWDRLSISLHVGSGPRFCSPLHGRFIGCISTLTNSSY